jgi:lipopolysaccharide biosynthesis glycosyltransferase
MFHVAVMLYSAIIHTKSQIITFRIFCLNYDGNFNWMIIIRLCLYPVGSRSPFCSFLESHIVMIVLGENSAGDTNTNTSYDRDGVCSRWGAL